MDYYLLLFSEHLIYMCICCVFVIVIIVCHILLVAIISLTTIEWLRERTEHLDIFCFSAHYSMVFYFRCSVYWWKGSVRF